MINRSIPVSLIITNHSISWKWIKAQYFKPDKTGQSRNKWILTDPDTGNQLKKMAWTPIVRHQQIKYNYSPYDVTLKEYFANRDQRERYSICKFGCFEIY